LTSEFGELLRHARNYKGVTLREAERETRISRNYLLALEHEDFAQLPALTYARGIVRRYAEYLGLDPVETLARFEDVHGQRSGGFRVVPAVKPLDVPSHWAPNFAIIAFMVVMSAVIFAWMYSAYFAPEDSLSTPATAANVAGASRLATPTVVLLPGGGENLAAPTPTAVPVPTTAPTPQPTVAPTATPAPTTHQFVLTVAQRVWVEAIVDGKTAYSDVIEAGGSRTFSGKQMRVSSGNAAFVKVSVDGKDQGTLGTTWDAQKTYP
jgi:cytoskeletal protein RodZ